MYRLSNFGAMIDDSVRMTAYAEALQKVVTPDSVVLDIGAGPGIMSLIAAGLGARRVVAVEPNPLVRVGARLAAENGFSDRITVIHGLSQQIELEEKADVVVGDLRGGLPNVPGHIEALADARQRLLKPGGVLIPLRDTVFAAPVEAEEAFSKLVSPWKGSDGRSRMAGAREAVLNQGIVPLTSFDKLLGPGRPISKLEYATVESPNIDATVNLPIEASGWVHGFSLWFETELIPGVGFSTAPDREKTVYGRVFLPLADPVEVAEGDGLRFSVKVVLDGDARVWVWRGRFSDAEGRKMSSFAQSTAFSNPESPSVREVFHDGCAPELSDDGEIVRAILLRIDGRRQLTELAKEIMVSHPERFECEEDAISTVRSVAERFGVATLCVGD